MQLLKCFTLLGIPTGGNEVVVVLQQAAYISTCNCGGCPQLIGCY